MQDDFQPKTKTLQSTSVLYLNVVQAAEQWRFLHAEVVRYQGVEAIGEIQYLSLRRTIGHSLNQEEKKNAVFYK